MSLRRRRPAQWLTLESNKAIGETIAISITRTAGAPAAAWRIVDGGQIYEYAGDALSHVVHVGPCKIECRIAPKWIAELAAANQSLTSQKNIQRCINLTLLQAYTNPLLPILLSEIKPLTQMQNLNLHYTSVSGDLVDLSENKNFTVIDLGGAGNAVHGSIANLASNPNLFYLDLDLSTVDGATGLGSCHALQYIFLNGCSLSKVEVDAIVADLYANRALSHTAEVGLNGNNSTPSATGETQILALVALGWTVARWQVGSLSANIVFEGDSLTNSAYPPKVNTDLGGAAAVRYQNVALGGERTSQMLAEGPSQIDAQYDAQYEHNIAVLWSGTNDYLAGRTASQILADIETWCLARRAAGFQTIVLTLHPENNVGYMAMRAEFNAALLADHDFCDAVADTTSETRLDPADPTYYIDAIHLTTAGYGLIAPFVESAVTSLLTE